MNLHVGEFHSTAFIDARGTRCPAAPLKLTSALLRMKTGDRVEVVGDCEHFEQDVREWCTRNHKVVLWMRRDDERARRCLVQL